MTSEIPKHIEDFLGTCPMAGEGLNTWLLRASNRLRHYISKDEAKLILAPISREHGRYNPREIERQVNTAYGDYTPGFEPPAYKPTPKWPEQSKAQIEAIAKDGPGLADLYDLSPIRLDDGGPHTEWVVDRLFPGNPWLCVGQSKSEFKTRNRERLRGELANTSFIVPSRQIAECGLTQDGRESEHSLSNTGPRDYLVTEFDFGPDTHDKQAAIIWYLRQWASLTMVVNSAGKSLHAWWHAHGSDEADDGVMHRFFRYAVSLGADPRMWLRSQFVRMPDGWRDDDKVKGKRQSVIYFDREACLK
jgi:hypothetical protein